MHPQIAALALHSQVVAALAHHLHKHTAGFYAHQAAGHFESAFKSFGPMGPVLLILLVLGVIGVIRYRRSSD